MDDRADNSVTEQFKKDTEKLNQEREFRKKNGSERKFGRQGLSVKVM